MILVVGGTEEGEKAAQALSTKKFYKDNPESFKTVHGEKILNGVVFLPKCLNCPMTTHLIRKYNVKTMVDATPIYFKKASLRAMSVCKITGARYIRFERPGVLKEKNERIHRVKNINEAALKAMKLGNVILIDIGDYNINIFTDQAHKKHKKIIARISGPVGLTNCLNFGIKYRNILLINGIFSKAFNRAIINEYGISVLVTRELGEGTAADIQAEAALEAGIHLVLIERPDLKYDEVVTDCGELVRRLKRTCQN